MKDFVAGSSWSYCNFLHCMIMACLTHNPRREERFDVMFMVYYYLIKVIKLKSSSNTYLYLIYGMCILSIIIGWVRSFYIFYEPKEQAVFLHYKIMYLGNGCHDTFIEKEISFLIKDLFYSIHEAG